MAEKMEQLRSGQVLFAQGEKPTGLYMLSEGTVEILSASDEYDGLDRGIIMSRSKRVGILTGKTLLSGFSPHLNGPYTRSIRAVTDASLTRYTLPPGGIQGYADSDPAQALNILRHLYNNIRAVSGTVARYAKLYQTACMMSDNMGLMYKELSETNTCERLHRSAEETHRKFRAKGGGCPSLFGARFLVTDNSSFLGKAYRLPEAAQEQPNTKFDDFILKTIQLEQKVVVPMFKADPTMASSMYDGLTESFTATLDRIEKIGHFADKELSILFGDADSWASYLIDAGGIGEWERSGKCEPEFVKNLLSLLVKVNGLYEELTGRKMTALFPSIRRIHQYYSSGKSGGEAASKAEAPAVISSGALNKSIQQIFEFAVVQRDFKTRFLKLLNEFKNAKNPFNTEQEGRKLRRHITSLYWDLYKQTYIRSMSETAVPRPVQMMLNFGFLDEGLLEEQQVADLTELSRLREKSREIPVLMETEFLSMIYEGKVEPSITEMGLNYQGYLDDLEKRRSKKEREDARKVDEHMAKTIYEIGQRLATTAAICSGSTATAFPILTSLMVRGSLKQLYTYKKNVESIAKEIRDIDFSVFYRETVLKMGEAREIIQEEVVPYFILLPIFGSRTLLWQDMTGTNKRSRGRIVVPVFFIGDLTRSLVHTFASFRWELNRDIKGAMWADPIDGGVTGEYFDYVNNFKKNTKLSVEAKEKIDERFRSVRNNRDRFADDYIQWVLYEKDGIMKLNNVVREMFFRHIPFRKDLREKLEAMPAFTQPATRYKNVHKREVEAYERKFKKYHDEHGQLPEELRKFFEFLNL
ncbi:MAG: cyclic nucleotide-binding domain-containing protein [Spirochaetes bacterium]|nr:cyclic nucleotide-binding domain-containing protein [Spirochaetota bacterium]